MLKITSSDLTDERIKYLVSEALQQVATDGLGGGTPEESLRVQREALDAAHLLAEIERQ